MALKTTRKILSIIFSAVIAFSVVCACTVAVLNHTYGSQSFYEKRIVTNELVASCNKQLEIKYDALEQKSGIPARVFQNVTSSFGTRESLVQAVSYLFDENDSSLYNDNRVDYFYDICVEYLEGNELEYNEKTVRNVAVEAAQIYSDTVGMRDIDEIKYHINRIDGISAKLESASILCCALFVLLIVIMYREREKAYTYVGSSFMAGGFATMLGSIAAMISRAGAGTEISPVVYQDVLASLAHAFMLDLVIAGFMVIIVGCLILAGGLYKINLEQKRKQSRFSKIVTNL